MSLYTGPPQTPVRTDTANNPTNHLNNSGTSIQANRGTPSLYRRQHTPAQPRADPTSSYPRTYTENGSINTHDNGVNSNLSLHQATSNTISSNPALPIPSQSGFQPTHPTPSFQRSTLSTTNPPRRPTAPLPPVSTSSSPGWLSRYHETSPEREIIRQSYQPFWRSYSPFDPHMTNLNAAQRAAVLSPLQPLLILASAGTGKTRTLIARLSHCLRKGADPSKVLAVTFTRKAASELRSRVAAQIGPVVGRSVTAATFHQIALRFLRQNASLVPPLIRRRYYDVDDMTTREEITEGPMDRLSTNAWGSGMRGTNSANNSGNSSNNGGVGISGYGGGLPPFGILAKDRQHKLIKHICGAWAQATLQIIGTPHEERRGLTDKKHQPRDTRTLMLMMEEQVEQIGEVTEQMLVEDARERMAQVGIPYQGGDQGGITQERGAGMTDAGTVGGIGGISGADRYGDIIRGLEHGGIMSRVDDQSGTRTPFILDASQLSVSSARNPNYNYAPTPNHPSTNTHSRSSGSREDGQDTGGDDDLIQLTQHQLLKRQQRLNAEASRHFSKQGARGGRRGELGAGVTDDAKEEGMGDAIGEGDVNEGGFGAVAALQLPDGDGMWESLETAARQETGGDWQLSVALSQKHLPYSLSQSTANWAASGRTVPMTCHSSIMSQQSEVDSMAGTHPVTRRALGTEGHALAVEIARVLTAIVTDGKRRGMKPQDYIGWRRWLFKLYGDEMVRMNCLDFDDMVPCLVDMIRVHASVRKDCASRYMHFFVDEFQDVSSDQWELLYLLSVGEDPILQMDDGCYNNHDGPDGDDLKELGASASSTANELGIMSKGRARPVYRQLSPFEAPAITCVGDDDQAIFSFRGGGGESFGFFAQAFRGVFAAMPLLETYRCTKSIVSVANAVISSNNPYRFPKYLRSNKPDVIFNNFLLQKKSSPRAQTQADIGTEQEPVITTDGTTSINQGSPTPQISFNVVVQSCGSEDNEVDRVIEYITRIHRNERRPWGHFCVLSRTRSALKPLHTRIKEIGAFPVTKAVRAPRDIHRSKESKALTSYLSLVAAEGDHRPNDFKLALNEPKRGLGPKVTETIESIAKEMNKPYTAAALELLKSTNKGLRPAQRESLQKFIEILRSAREICSRLTDRNQYLSQYAAEQHKYMLKGKEMSGGRGTDHVDNQTDKVGDDCPQRGNGGSDKDDHEVHEKKCTDLLNAARSVEEIVRAKLGPEVIQCARSGAKYIAPWIQAEDINEGQGDECGSATEDAQKGGRNNDTDGNDPHRGREGVRRGRKTNLKTYKWLPPMQTAIAYIAYKVYGSEALPPAEEGWSTRLSEPITKTIQTNDSKNGGISEGHHSKGRVGGRSSDGCVDTSGGSNDVAGRREVTHPSLSSKLGELAQGNKKVDHVERKMYDDDDQEVEKAAETLHKRSVISLLLRRARDVDDATMAALTARFVPNLINTEFGQTEQPRGNAQSLQRTQRQSGLTPVSRNPYEDHAPDSPLALMIQSLTQNPLNIFQDVVYARRVLRLLANDVQNDALSNIYCAKLEEEGKLASGSVTLSTIHSAKGLEWPVVVLIRCSDGQIPIGVNDQNLIDQGWAGEQNAIKAARAHIKRLQDTASTAILNLSDSRSSSSSSSSSSFYSSTSSSSSSEDAISLLPSSTPESKNATPPDTSQDLDPELAAAREAVLNYMNNLAGQATAFAHSSQTDDGLQVDKNDIVPSSKRIKLESGGEQQPHSHTPGSPSMRKTNLALTSATSPLPSSHHQTATTTPALSSAPATPSRPRVSSSATLGQSPGATPHARRVAFSSGLDTLPTVRVEQCLDVATAAQLQNLHEERRLFYVAITRAKDLCIITHPTEKFGASYLRSIFLDEIPLNVLQAGEDVNASIQALDALINPPRPTPVPSAVPIVRRSLYGNRSQTSRTSSSVEPLLPSTLLQPTLTPTPLPPPLVPSSDPQVLIPSIPIPAYESTPMADSIISTQALHEVIAVDKHQQPSEIPASNHQTSTGSRVAKPAPSLYRRVTR